MELPETFLRRMQALLGAEFGDFLESYSRPAYQGVRLNPLKCDLDTLRRALPVPLIPAPFSPFGYYAPELRKPGSLPAHRAGMFYSQEPSAAAPVTVLDPQPGERVLDLCAAPGGKATQIAGLMQGEGLLWANEVVRERANALLSNLERLGVRNSVISCCHPQRLCQGLRGYFDRVLVDAPCSGEGMFRREPEGIGEWAPESPAACAQRQRRILDSAALAVKEGGVLVYSTCTFAREENEDVVASFLREHSEFEPLPIDVDFGRPGFDGLSRRVLPMDGGEGHFMAKLRRIGENPCRVRRFDRALNEKQARPARALYESLFADPPDFPLAKAGSRLLALPGELPALEGLGVLRAGVELGEERGSRIEPAHGLFVSRQKAQCRQALDFSPGAPALAAFFRGEEIDCAATGYTAVCVCGVTAGFGKASGGKLKNRYPKGLRSP